MADVDAGLKALDIPIHARPTHALMQIAKRLNVREAIPIMTRPIAPDDFTAASLGGQIHTWYERQYGDRLKVHPGPGSVLVEIRSDAWEMRLPLLFGSARLVCDASTLGRRHPPRSPLERGVTYNVLNAIVDMTPQLAGSLSSTEQWHLLSSFKAGVEILEGTRSEAASPFVTEALSDFAESVRCFMDRRAYGQSKWASLQFVEKLMKSKLTVAGTAFKKVHVLKELNQLLGSKLQQTVIDEIQCPAGVRYGEVVVLREAALRAHLAALRAARTLGFGPQDPASPQ